MTKEMTIMIALLRERVVGTALERVVDFLEDEMCHLYRKEEVSEDRLKDMRETVLSLEGQLGSADKYEERLRTEIGELQHRCAEYHGQMLALEQKVRDLTPKVNVADIVLSDDERAMLSYDAAKQYWEGKIQCIVALRKRYQSLGKSLPLKDAKDFVDQYVMGLEAESE